MSDLSTGIIVKREGKIDAKAFTGFVRSQAAISKATGKSSGQAAQALSLFVANSGDKIPKEAYPAVFGITPTDSVLVALGGDRPIEVLDYMLKKRHDLIENGGCATLLKNTKNPEAISAMLSELVKSRGLFGLGTPYIKKFSPSVVSGIVEAVMSRPDAVNPESAAILVGIKDESIIASLQPQGNVANYFKRMASFGTINTPDSIATFYEKMRAEQVGPHEIKDIFGVIAKSSKLKKEAKTALSRLEGLLDLTQPVTRVSSEVGGLSARRSVEPSTQQREALERATEVERFLYEVRNTDEITQETIMAFRARFVTLTDREQVAALTNLILNENVEHEHLRAVRDLIAGVNDRSVNDLFMEKARIADRRAMTGGSQLEGLLSRRGQQTAGLRV
jgi:hypothetical protein